MIVSREQLHAFDSFSAYLLCLWLPNYASYRMFNNWYTSETQPIDPFVLEGLPLFTILPSEDRDHTDSRRINKYIIVMTINHLHQ